MMLLLCKCIISPMGPDSMHRGKDNDLPQEGSRLLRRAIRLRHWNDLYRWLFMRLQW